MIIKKAAGKLFIGGEYAIREAGYSAILVGLDRFITVKLEESSHRGRIESSKGGVSWERKEGRLIPQDSRGLDYVLAAMNLMETYRQDLARQTSYYSLSIESEMEAQDGRKYGLGSSGAVVVATISALGDYYSMNLTREEIFKLSSLASLRINGEASCGDLAAIVYGGWVHYQSFDRVWLRDKANEASIGQLLELDWPGLHIEKLLPPRDLKLAVAWTGSPASTPDLVDRVERASQRQDQAYREFLDRSQSCLEDMVLGFRQGDRDRIIRGIRSNRAILLQLARDLQVDIETGQLKKLSDLGLAHGISCKSSGAGGGDCGICLYRGEDLEGLIEDWQKEGIFYLDLEPYDY